MAISTRRDTLLPVVAIISVIFAAAHGFIPNQNGRFKDSTAHDQMTESAVVRMARLFMDDYPDIYPDQDETLATDDFILALNNFKLGSAVPDTEESLINHPPAHFDAEQIVQSNQRILDQRGQVISAINGDDMATAQEMTGQLIHTLQDFYR